MRLTNESRNYTIKQGDFLKNRLFPAYFSLSLILINVIRTIQLALLTDAKTGFYLDEYHGLGGLLSIVLVVVIFICGGLSLLSSFKIADVPAPSVPLGIAQLLLGVALCVEVFFSASLPSSVHIMFVAVRILLMVLSGIVFIYFGFMNFAGKKPRYFLILIPILLWLVRIAVTFISYTGISNISSNLYEIAMLAFTILFLSGHGKLLCGVASRSTKKLTLITGVIAALFSSICCIPQIIMIILGRQAELHASVDSIATSIFVVIYIVTYLLSKEYKQPKHAKRGGETSEPASFDR